MLLPGRGMSALSFVLESGPAHLYPIFRAPVVDRPDNHSATNLYTLTRRIPDFGFHEALFRAA